MRIRNDWPRLMAFGVLTAWAATMAAAAEKSDPSGTWTWVRALEGESARSVLKLSYKDGKLTGVYKRLGQAVPIINGKFERNEVSFEADGKWGEQTVHGKFQGKVSKDAIRGDIEVSVDGGSLPLSWVATRGVDFDDVTGTWTLKIELPNGPALQTTLQLSASGEKLDGSFKSPSGEEPAKAVTLAGPNLSWTIEGSYQGKKAKAVYHAKTEGDRMKGTLQYEYDGHTGTIEFSGQRTADKSRIQPTGPDKKSVSQNGRRSSKDLTVFSVSSGKRVWLSIGTNDRRILVNEITLEEMRAKYPELYEEFLPPGMELVPGTERESSDRVH